jgi:hypothetical protein
MTTYHLNVHTFKSLHRVYRHFLHHRINHMVRVIEPTKENLNRCDTITLLILQCEQELRQSLPKDRELVISKQEDCCLGVNLATYGCCTLKLAESVVVFWLAIEIVY